MTANALLRIVHAPTTCCTLPLTVRAPDVLVRLQLEAHLQLVLENPLRQILRREDAVDRGEQHGRAPAVQRVSRHDVARELVVHAVANHELHLVVRRQQAQVLPVVPGRLAAARALHIDDPDHLRGNLLDAEVSAGLDHHRQAGVEQAIHQRIDVALEQRLTASDLDQPASKARHLPHHVVHATLGALVERVLRIAPRTPEIAGGQAHEDARPTRVRRFSLDRMENLVDRQHFTSLLGAGVGLRIGGRKSPRGR